MKIGALEVKTQLLVDLCNKWQICRLEAFGSVLRPDFRADSDVDLLVEFAPDAEPTYFDLFHAEQDFQRVLGHPVELVSRRGLDAGENPILRDEILKTKVTLYAA